MVKDIYILHVAGRLAFYRHSKTCPSYGFAPRENFIDFIKSLREDYPDYRLRYIRNKGIENWLEKKFIQQQQMIKNKLENNY